MRWTGISLFLYIVKMTPGYVTPGYGAVTAGCHRLISNSLILDKHEAMGDVIVGATLRPPHARTSANPTMANPTKRNMVFDL
jgi:hypothetical protein